MTKEKSWENVLPAIRQAYFVAGELSTTQEVMDMREDLLIEFAHKVAGIPVSKLFEVVNEREG